MFLRLTGVLVLLALALPAAACLAEAQGEGGPPPQETTAAEPGALSPRNASYRISARLDPDTQTITGDEVITWRNISNRAADTLRFHLYYNAWRNTGSSWMRERILGGNTELARRPADDFGSIDLTSLRVGSRETAATGAEAAVPQSDRGGSSVGLG